MKGWGKSNPSTLRKQYREEYSAWAQDAAADSASARAMLAAERAAQFPPPCVRNGASGSGHETRITLLTVNCCEKQDPTTQTVAYSCPVDSERTSHAIGGQYLQRKTRGHWLLSRFAEVRAPSSYMAKTNGT